MKVLAFVSAFVVAAPLASAEIVLLDFSARSCQPCRDMEPIVAGLEREGYRIERVNIETDQGRAKKKKFNVTHVPTFIALTDGRESGRVVGAVPADRLKQLAGPDARMAAKLAVSGAKSPANPRGEIALADLTTTGSSASGSDLIESSVRLVVDDARSKSFGTGTVIRSVPGETLILTCGHLFEGISRSAKTTIEFFGSPDRVKLAGELVARDRDADLSLVRVATPQVVPASRVASREFTPAIGMPALSVGCDNGKEPSVRSMKITAVNRYLGAPTIECNNEPVEGRSGGGLFNEAGEVIGVCSAREPSEHRGIYGGLAAVQSLLDRQGLSSIYKSRPPADWRLASNADKSGPKKLVLPPPEQIGLRTGSDTPLPPGIDQAEVVVVVRPVDDPKAPARVVVINRASAEFLAQLEREQSAQGSRNNTAMRLSNSADRAAGKDSSDAKRAGPAPREPVEEGAKWKKDWTPGGTSANSAGRR